MRRTLARTRDNLDVLSLPDTEGTELNYRTRVWSDAVERHFAIRMLCYITIKVVVTTFIIRLHTYWSVALAAMCFLPLAALMLMLAFSRYIRGWPAGVRLYAAISHLLAFALFAALASITEVRTAYIALGVAIGFGAYLSHVIAKQYVFFMTANERLRVRIVKRWQGFWSASSAWKAKRFLPELSAYTASFPLLIVPYAVGFGALLGAEQSMLSPFAGAIAVAAFLVTLPVLWILLGHLRIAPAAPLRRSLWVTWRALVTWFCYNRHQTPAAGVFRFPTRWVRNPYYRDLAVYASFTLLALAILSAASLSPEGAVRGLKSTAGDMWTGLSAPEPTRGRDELQPFSPKERLVLEHLPPGKQDAYRRAILARRKANAERARAAHLELSHLAPTAWLVTSALSILLCLLGPPLAFFLVFWFIAGRLLTAYHEALEAPDAYEQSPSKSVWDIRVERILGSRDELEREHIYIGKSCYNDYPVLLHLNLLRAHAHILGDTGSRKTSIGIAPVLTQLIAREDSSVRILDLKGDMALFECAKAEAKNAGIPFKYFTNITGHSSFVFNPFSQSHMHQLSTNQKTQGILQALSLEYGEGYGESYYSAMHEIVLSTYMRKYRDIGSFKDLHSYLTDKNAYRGIGDMNDWEKARHLTTLAHKLAEVYPLNLKPSELPGRPELFAKQIDMPSLLRKKQVVYFYLISSLEPTTVSPVAKLAMFALLSAAARRGKEDKNRIYVFVDEFQRVISENVKIFLEQARSKKLHFILANQTTGQRESGGTDLTDTVDSCTAYKQSFKATDLRSLEKLIDSSGEALYHEAAWSEAIDSGLSETWDGTFDIGHLPTGIFDASDVKVKETLGPRLEKNTIIELSAKPMASFVRFTEGSGYTQFSGYYTPILSDFHISQAEFEKREQADWPPVDEETVIGYADNEEPPGGRTADAGRSPAAEKPFVTGHPAGPPPPENVPDDFDRHLDERLKGPEVPTRIPRPGKRPTSPPSPRS